MHRLLPLLSLLMACGEPDKDDTAAPVDTGNTEDTGGPPVDSDRDGYSTVLDCDDTDPAVNPGATEIPYNGVDDDCDPNTWDDDLDADSHSAAEDCDDDDPSAYPGADEVCDLVDNDCDGRIDENTATTWYPDRDLDEYGDDVDGFSTDDCSDPPLWQQTEVIIAELLLDADADVSTLINASTFDGRTDDWTAILTDDVFITSVTIWDEMGVDHELTLAFERDHTWDWSWYGVVDGGEIDGGTEGYPYELTTGTLHIDSDGSLASFTGTSSASTGPHAWTTGADVQSLDLRLGLDSSGATTDGSVSMAGAGHRVLDIHADGYPWLVLIGGDCDDSDPAVYPGAGGCS